MWCVWRAAAAAAAGWRKVSGRLAELHRPACKRVQQVHNSPPCAVTCCLSGTSCGTTRHSLAAPMAALCSAAAAVHTKPRLSHRVSAWGMRGLSGRGARPVRALQERTALARLADGGSDRRMRGCRLQGVEEGAGVCARAVHGSQEPHTILSASLCLHPFSASSINASPVHGPGTCAGSQPKPRLKAARAAPPAVELVGSCSSCKQKSPAGIN